MTFDLHRNPVREARIYIRSSTMSAELVASLHLRPAVPEDEPLLLSIYESTRREEVGSWGWSPEQSAVFLRMQFYARRRAYAEAYPEAVESILMAGEKPAGSMLVSRAVSEIRLVDLALFPEFRGQGIATSLIRGLIGESEASGLPLGLCVAYGNPASRLYERLGFAVVQSGGMYSEMTYEPGGLPLAAPVMSNFSASLFRPHLHSTFAVHATETDHVELELVELEERASSPQMELFALLFRGPSSPQLEQGTYRLEHAELGALDLFLVPIGPHGQGWGYEAVFNLLRQPDAEGG
jgi:ribosomal protein S18 acetylase RimI-like enzyme